MADKRSPDEEFNPFASNEPEVYNPFGDAGKSKVQLKVAFDDSPPSSPNTFSFNYQDNNPFAGNASSSSFYDDKSLQQLDEPEETAGMLAEERAREDKERQQALQQSFNNNEAYAQPTPAPTQPAAGFGDKLSAFFSSGGGGKSRGQDQGEIAFAGNPANNTVTAKATATTAAGERVLVTRSDTAAADEEELSYLTLDYYKQFADIETTEVLWRCARSFWPFKFDFVRYVKANPDVYGPFWISCTMVFMFAATSNFVAYMNSNSADPWKTYDITKVTIGFPLIFSFNFGIPILFWIYFRWIDFNVSLVELLCIYGYSNTVYILASILCLIPPSAYVTWAVIGLACLISSSFLLSNLWLPLRSKLGHAIFILLFMGVLNAACALCYQLYFYQNWKFTPPAPPTMPPTWGPTPVPFTIPPLAPTTSSPTSPSI